MENKEIKGIIARDNTNWQTEFEDAVKISGCGVMWKDQLSDFGEIREKLQHMISIQGYFDFYNIAKSYSNFHGRIIDFATRDEYPEKMHVWQKRNPAWFSESFDGYSDGSQKAIIAFLVKDFESIPLIERIHINQFVTFNNKQASIKNAVAYTDIITTDIITQQAMINKTNELLLSNYNLILAGAPGTGKTYLAKQIASQMILGKEFDDKSNEDKKKMNEQCGFVQFHPSYDYTDFVEGLRPIDDGKGNVSFRREDGIFMMFCRKALEAYNNAEDKGCAPKYVFIIDEINRGELSKIFGELFFSIDPGYRGENGQVKTQYCNLWKEVDKFSGHGTFFIPKNVYIIGTMNDIDRSIESMDFAMRRRFAFKEIQASDTIEMIKSNSHLKEYYQLIEERMRNLNYCILTIQGFSTAYQIGAAYFLKLANYLEEEKLTDKSWKDLWNNHLQGLLFEYLRGLPNADEELQKLHRAYLLEEKYKLEEGKVVKDE